ncbi:unnamed protein product [Amoebophrya sp. A25]|nr:unnamed protein product [Amoebophrya sp. A25]|eukprot:GSA25T00015528001.1
MSSATCSRRAVEAARFLRPPGYMKRVQMREKPRKWTGPYENPVRRWVRLREKAKQFCALPPPRKVPVPRPSSSPGTVLIKDVEDVPNVSSEVLDRRLEWLLGPRAIQQQLQAPMVAGATPYLVESRVWQRQLTEVRRIYRAQYLQKLQEVTKTEREREEKLQEEERARRAERKQKALAKQCEDRKRRAILRDRLRTDGKVTQIFQMQRRSRLKMRRLRWLSEYVDRQRDVEVFDKLHPQQNEQESEFDSDRDSDDSFVGASEHLVHHQAALGARDPIVKAQNKTLYSKGLAESATHLGAPVNRLVQEEPGKEASSPASSTTRSSRVDTSSASALLGSTPSALSDKKDSGSNLVGGRKSNKALSGRPDLRGELLGEQVSEALFDRDVSVPHVMRQLGAAREFPRQKNRRIPEKKNLVTEVKEQSYDILPEDHFTQEDASRLEAGATPELFPTAAGRQRARIRQGLLKPKEDADHAPLSASRRAEMEYGVFSKQEQKKLLDEKIKMLEHSLAKAEHLSEMPGQKQLEQQLLEQLQATKLAMVEREVVARQKAKLQKEAEQAAQQAESS